jgi:beta-phosphoglucomutase
MAIQAVIFDMDGVLIDARDWHYRALNEALAYFGTTITPEQHLADFDGLPTKKKLAALSQAGKLPVHLHALVEVVKQERTLREAANLCFPKVEHLVLIGWLRAHGFKLAVATNSIRQTSRAMLEFAGVLDSMDTLVTNEDVEKPKPSPEIYLLACERLKVKPENVLVIEDNHFGVRAATDAGCNVIQVSGPDEVNLRLIKGELAKRGQF